MLLKCLQLYQPKQEADKVDNRVPPVEPTAPFHGKIKFVKYFLTFSSVWRWGSIYREVWFTVSVNKRPREKKEYRRKRLLTEAPVSSQCTGVTGHPPLERAADKSSRSGSWDSV